MTETIERQTITVDGFVAYDGVDPPADDDGNTYIWQTIDGWFGGLDVRGGPVARPLADGEYDGPAPFGGRTVTIGGTLLATTRAGLQHGLDRIAAVLAGPTRRSELVVDEAQRGVARQALVRLGGPTQIGRAGPYQADWSLSLYCSDPLRYGTTGHSLLLLPFAAGGGRTYNLIPNRHYGTTGQTGKGTAVNAGNAATPMVITFIGPCTNPGLRLTGGDEIQYLGVVASNEQVVIDTGAKTVLLNGANRRQNLAADSRWLKLAPGSNELFFWVDNVTKTGTCLVTWMDAWI